MKKKILGVAAAFLLLAPAGLLLAAVPASAEEPVFIPSDDCEPLAESEIGYCGGYGEEVQLPPTGPALNPDGSLAGYTKSWGCVVNPGGEPQLKVSVDFLPAEGPRTTANTADSGCYEVSLPTDSGTWTVTPLVPPGLELVSTPPVITAATGGEIPDIVLSGLTGGANTPPTNTPEEPAVAVPALSKPSTPSICSTPEPLVAGIFGIGVLLVAIAVLLTLAARKRLKNDLAEKARSEADDFVFTPEQMKHLDALKPHDKEAAEAAWAEYLEQWKAEHAVSAPEVAETPETAEATEGSTPTPTPAPYDWKAKRDQKKAAAIAALEETEEQS